MAPLHVIYVQYYKVFILIKPSAIRQRPAIRQHIKEHAYNILSTSSIQSHIHPIADNSAAKSCVLFTKSPLYTAGQNSSAKPQKHKKNKSLHL